MARGGYTYTSGAINRDILTLLNPDGTIRDLNSDGSADHTDVLTWALSGNDTITGSALGDTLIGGEGNDTFSGMDGDDILNGGAGDDYLNGGAGNDTAEYIYANAGVTVRLANTGAQGTGAQGTDTLVNIENLNGSNYNDFLTGNTAANVLNGGAGNDVLEGGDGTDTLIGGAGNDYMRGDAGADTMDGGDGNDNYLVDDAGDVVTETNALASGGIDTVISFMTSYTLGANVEIGYVAVQDANLTGNALNNTLYAGAGNNTLDGGTGVDTASYLYAASAVTVNLATVGAQATGGSGSDTLVGIENLTGSNYNDFLTGDTAANILIGGVGADTMAGGDGNDTLIGGAGVDTLTGGSGSDKFKFLTMAEGADSIADFATGADKIQVIASNFGLTAGAAVSFLSGASTPAASGTSAQFLYDTTTGGLYFDRDGTNGTYSAVHIATLTGPKALAGSDIQVVSS